MTPCSVLMWIEKYRSSRRSYCLSFTNQSFLLPSQRLAWRRSGPADIFIVLPCATHSSVHLVRPRTSRADTQSSLQYTEEPQNPTFTA